MFFFAAIYDRHLKFLLKIPMTFAHFYVGLSIVHASLYKNTYKVEFGNFFLGGGIMGMLV